MKSDEKKYAALRLRAALDYRLGQLKKKHMRPEKKLKLTDRQMRQEIRDGTVELKMSFKLDDPIRDCYDFSDVIGQEVLDVTAFDPEAAILRKEAAEIKDMFMLGTVADEVAVRALTEFCKDCPGA